MKTIFHYISEYMGILVLIVAILSLIFPGVAGQIPPKTINYLLGIVMFGMGLTMNLHDFKVIFTRPRDVTVGFFAQFLIMPTLAILLSWLFSLDKALMVGVVLVGCCPGGTASNVITYLSKGDLALSVGITSLTTIFAPIVTPLLVWLLAGQKVEVDVMSMFMSILTVIIIPIVLGFIIKRFFPRFSKRAVGYLPGISTLAIATIVAIVVSTNADKLLHGSLAIVALVVLHNLLGLVIGYCLGLMMGLPWSKRKAISIEVGMQNSGLASSLAALHFAAYPMATIPGALFSVWHNISGAIVAKIYSRLGKDEQKLSSEVSKSQ